MDEPKAFDSVARVIELMGGLTLSQLSEVSDVEPGTIQNWVKRGWVGKPINKRYSYKPVSRLMLLSMLNKTLKLGDIVKMIDYVNTTDSGKTVQAIEDYELYNMLSSMKLKIKESPYISPEIVEQFVADEMKDYHEPFGGAYRKVKNVLLIMALAYLSGAMATQAQSMYDAMINGNIGY